MGSSSCGVPLPPLSGSSRGSPHAQTRAGSCHLQTGGPKPQPSSNGRKPGVSHQAWTPGSGQPIPAGNIGWCQHGSKEQKGPSRLGGARSFTPRISKEPLGGRNTRGLGGPQFPSTIPVDPTPCCWGPAFCSLRALPPAPSSFQRRKWGKGSPAQVLPTPPPHWPPSSGPCLPSSRGLGPSLWKGEKGQVEG